MLNTQEGLFKERVLSAQAMKEHFYKLPEFPKISPTEQLAILTRLCGKPVLKTDAIAVVCKNYCYNYRNKDKKKDKKNTARAVSTRS